MNIRNWLLSSCVFSALLGAMSSSELHARVGPPSEVAAALFKTKDGKEFYIWVHSEYKGRNFKKGQGGKLIYQEFKIYSKKNKKKFIILDEVYVDPHLELDVQLSYIKRVRENKSGDLIVIVGGIFGRFNPTFLIKKADLDALR